MMIVENLPGSMMIVENLKNIRARGTKLSYPRHALIRSRMVLTRSSGTNSYSSNAISGPRVRALR
jgi:hypothetical protein